MHETSWAKNKGYMYNDKYTHANTLLYHKHMKVKKHSGTVL